MAGFQWSRFYVRPTTCKYTVVTQCCDPPIPAAYFNTNNKKAARRAFEKLKAEEIEKGGGGEFSITLYEHKKKPEKVVYHRLSAEEGDYDHPYVYGIFYDNKSILDEFTYMDCYKDLI